MIEKERSESFNQEVTDITHLGGLIQTYKTKHRFISKEKSAEHFSFDCVM